jgi:DNA replication protein DnaC
MYTLPPLPATVRSLNDAEAQRLRHILPNLQMSLDGCQTCLGKRTFRWVADPTVPIERAEIVDYTCDCRGQFRLSRYLLAHNMGIAAARWCWGDVQHVPDPPLAQLMKYAADCQHYASQGIGLCLYSEMPGTGKTLMAALILKSFLAAGIEGYWVTFAELMVMYTSTFRDNEERRWFDRHIRNAPVLVIDDLGKEAKGLKETTDPALDLLLRTRVQNGLVTIITTNLTREQIAERYTPALASLASESIIRHEFPSLAFNVRDWSTKRKVWEIDNGIRRPWMLA